MKVIFSSFNCIPFLQVGVRWRLPLLFSMLVWMHAVSGLPQRPLSQAAFGATAHVTPESSSVSQPRTEFGVALPSITNSRAEFTPSLTNTAANQRISVSSSIEHHDVSPSREVLFSSRGSDVRTKTGYQNGRMHSSIYASVENSDELPFRANLQPGSRTGYTAQAIPESQGSEINSQTSTSISSSIPQPLHITLKKVNDEINSEVNQIARQNSFNNKFTIVRGNNNGDPSIQHLLKTSAFGRTLSQATSGAPSHFTPAQHRTDSRLGRVNTVSSHTSNQFGVPLDIGYSVSQENSVEVPVIIPNLQPGSRSIFGALANPESPTSSNIQQPLNFRIKASSDEIISEVNQIVRQNSLSNQFTIISDNDDDNNDEFSIEYVPNMPLGRRYNPEGTPEVQQPLFIPTITPKNNVPVQHAPIDNPLWYMPKESSEDNDDYSESVPIVTMQHTNDNRQRIALSESALNDRYNFIDAQGSVNWGYSLTDQYQSAKVHEDGIIEGKYGWTAPNGQEIKVQYIADEGGYRILSSLNIHPIDEPVVQAAKEAHLREVERVTLRGTTIDTTLSFAHPGEQTGSEGAEFPAGHNTKFGTETVQIGRPLPGLEINNVQPTGLGMGADNIDLELGIGTVATGFGTDIFTDMNIGSTGSGTSTGLETHTGIDEFENSSGFGAGIGSTGFGIGLPPADPGVQSNSASTGLGSEFGVDTGSTGIGIGLHPANVGAQSGFDLTSMGNKFGIGLPPTGSTGFGDDIGPTGFDIGLSPTNIGIESGSDSTVMGSGVGIRFPPANSFGFGADTGSTGFGIGQPTKNLGVQSGFDFTGIGNEFGIGLSPTGFTGFPSDTGSTAIGVGLSTINAGIQSGFDSTGSGSDFGIGFPPTRSTGFAADTGSTAFGVGLPPTNTEVQSGFGSTDTSSGIGIGLFPTDVGIGAGFGGSGTTTGFGVERLPTTTGVGSQIGANMANHNVEIGVGTNQPEFGIGLHPTSSMSNKGNEFGPNTEVGVSLLDIGSGAERGTTFGQVTPFGADSLVPTNNMGIGPGSGSIGFEVNNTPNTGSTGLVPDAGLTGFIPDSELSGFISDTGSTFLDSNTGSIGFDPNTGSDVVSPGVGSTGFESNPEHGSDIGFGTNIGVSTGSGFGSDTGTTGFGYDSDSTGFGYDAGSAGFDFGSGLGSNAGHTSDTGSAVVGFNTASGSDTDSGFGINAGSTGLESNIGSTGFGIDIGSEPNSAFPSGSEIDATNGLNEFAPDAGLNSLKKNEFLSGSVGTSSLDNTRGDSFGFNVGVNLPGIGVSDNNILVGNTGSTNNLLTGPPIPFSVAEGDQTASKTSGSFFELGPPETTAVSNMGGPPSSLDSVISDSINSSQTIPEICLHLGKTDPSLLPPECKNQNIATSDQSFVANIPEQCLYIGKLHPALVSPECLPYISSSIQQTVPKQFNTINELSSGVAFSEIEPSASFFTSSSNAISVNNEKREVISPNPIQIDTNEHLDSEPQHSIGHSPISSGHPEQKQSIAERVPQQPRPVDISENQDNASIDSLDIKKKTEELGVIMDKMSKSVGQGSHRILSVLKA